jgi:transcription antitermination protein NusB
MASRRKSRRLAVQGLYSWDVGRTDLSHLLALDWVDEKTLGDADFARLLIQGTVEAIEEIDALIEQQLEHWDIARLHKVDLAILRVGTFSLRYQLDVPAHVTIDEAVELAKEMSTDEAFRFINGVLDGVRKRVRKTE